MKGLKTRDSSVWDFSVTVCHSTLSNAYCESLGRTCNYLLELAIEKLAIWLEKAHRK